MSRDARTGAFHTGTGTGYAAGTRMPVKGAHRNPGTKRMTQHRNPFEIELDKNEANYVPLSPLSFIRRTASVYPNRTAVIHGAVRRTWAESYERCVRLASALSKRGVGLGTTVAVMAPNIPEVFEAHFGVPMAGGVLNALNIRLDAEAIAFQLQHGEAKVLITDREFSGVINKAVHMIDPRHRPIVIDIDDPLAKGGDLIGEQTYEQFAEVSKVGLPIMIQDAPLSGVDLPVPLLVRMAREIEQVKLFKIECPRAAAKLRALIEAGGDAIEGPFDGEEAITLLADLDAGATGTMTSAMIPDQIKPVLTHWAAGDRAAATAAYARILPAVNHENRQCGFLSAKAVMREGGVIRSDFSRHPIPPLHPATRAMLLDLVRPLDPVALRWGK